MKIKTASWGLFAALGLLAAPRARCSEPANLKRGEELFAAKNYEEALPLLLKAADEPGVKEIDAAEALLTAGVTCDWLASTRKDRAYLDRERNLFERLIVEYPDSPRAADAFLYLGQVFSGDILTDCPKAIKLYKQAIAKADRDWIKAQAQGRIGQCLDRMGLHEQAEAVYREVIAKYPKTPWGSVEIPKLLESRGRR